MRDFYYFVLVAAFVTGVIRGIIRVLKEAGIIH